VMTHKDCWACELARGARSQHKTPWYYLVPKVGLVCEDLQSKGYDKRLLFVPIECNPCGSESESDHELAKVILARVTKRRLPEYRIVGYDLTNHSYRAHWHAQANLRKRIRDD